MQIIAIKTYEDRLAEMRRKMTKMEKDFNNERKFLKNASIAYAIGYYKNKSTELTQVFTEEGLRMVEKYTQLRKHLLHRDEQLKIVAMKTIFQETQISELHQFIQENLEPAMNMMEIRDKIQQKAVYQNPKQKASARQNAVSSPRQVDSVRSVTDGTMSADTLLPPGQVFGAVAT